MIEDLLPLAQYAAGVAKSAGADDAQVVVTRSRQVVVDWRDNRLDRFRESTRRRLVIDVYVAGRYSRNATSDLGRDAIANTVTAMVAQTRFLARDRHRQLPDGPRRFRANAPDLQIFDGRVRGITPECRLATVKNLESAVRDGDRGNAATSTTVTVGDEDQLTALFATNGLAAQEASSKFWQAISVSATDRDNRKPRGVGYAATRVMAALPTPEWLANEALQRALAQREPVQIATGQYDVIVENRAVPVLASYLLRPLLGSALQQKRSFLQHQYHRQIAASGLTIVDDPHRLHGLSSTGRDREGLATVPRTIIDRGCLHSFYLDSYYAAKLGQTPTSGQPTNWVWHGEPHEVEAMIGALDKGLYISGFLGGNSNDTTGDFSLGFKGFYIEKGQRKHPVSQMNIAGNHLALWPNLVALGNDPWPYASNQSPTLWFRGVRCTGSNPS